MCSPAPRPARPPAPRVLVIEDDARAGALLGEVLSGERYDVHIAADGAEGLAAAVAFDPHFVLLDVHLPVVHGIEVAQHLRVAEDGHQRVIIGTSGFGPPRGEPPPAFDHWVPKPIDIDQLCALLHDEWQERFADHAWHA
jgi:CheY-like chemotaxis protein